MTHTVLFRIKEIIRVDKRKKKEGKRENERIILLLLDMKSPKTISNSFYRMCFKDFSGLWTIYLQRKEGDYKNLLSI